MKQFGREIYMGKNRAQGTCTIYRTKLSGATAQACLPSRRVITMHVNVLGIRVVKGIYVECYYFMQNKRINEFISHISNSVQHIVRFNMHVSECEIKFVDLLTVSTFL